MDGLIVNKILSGVDTCFKVLGRYSKNLQEGKATHQWLLDKYLKLEEESLNNVLEELKMDSQEFSSLLYDLQLRLRALRDILNPFNMKVDEITEELKIKV